MRVFANDRGQRVVSHGRNARHDDVPLTQTRLVLDPSYRERRVCHESRRVGQKFTADGGKLDRPCRTINKPCSKIVFELLHASGQSGLGHMKAIGRLSKAACLGDDHESLNTVKVYFHDRLSPAVAG